MVDASFPKEDRIKSPRQFERVFKQGVVVADDILVVHVTRSDRDTPRIGIGVAKKAGNAPVRNRWKRLIREAFRKQKGTLPPLDIIIRPKRGAQPDYHRIYHSLPRLLARGEKRLSRGSGGIGG